MSGNCHDSCNRKEKDTDKTHVSFVRGLFHSAAVPQFPCSSSSDAFRSAFGGTSGNSAGCHDVLPIVSIRSACFCPSLDPALQLPRLKSDRSFLLRPFQHTSTHWDSLICAIRSGAGRQERSYVCGV